jgi:hypothetical protein
MSSNKLWGSQVNFQNMLRNILHLVVTIFWIEIYLTWVLFVNKIIRGIVVQTKYKLHIWIRNELIWNFLYLILKALKFFRLSDYLSLFVPSICSSLLFCISVRHRSLSPPLALSMEVQSFHWHPKIHVMAWPPKQVCSYHCTQPFLNSQ